MDKVSRDRFRISVSIFVINTVSSAASSLVSVIVRRCVGYTPVGRVSSATSPPRRQPCMTLLSADLVGLGTVIHDSVIEFDQCDAISSVDRAVIVKIRFDRRYQ